MTQYVKENIEKIETPMVTWALCGIVFVFFITYAFFMNSTIQNTILRASLEENVASLSSHLGDIESEYLSAKSVVSIAMAESLGFKEVSKSSTRFVQARFGDVGITFNR